MVSETQTGVLAETVLIIISIGLQQSKILADLDSSASRFTDGWNHDQVDACGDPITEIDPDYAPLIGQ